MAEDLNQHHAQQMLLMWSASNGNSVVLCSSKSYNQLQHGRGPCCLENGHTLDQSGAMSARGQAPSLLARARGSIQTVCFLLLALRKRNYQRKKLPQVNHRHTRRMAYAHTTTCAHARTHAHTHTCGGISALGRSSLRHTQTETHTLTHTDKHTHTLQLNKHA